MTRYYEVNGQQARVEIEIIMELTLDGALFGLGNIDIALNLIDHNKSSRANWVHIDVIDERGNEPHGWYSRIQNSITKQINAEWEKIVDEYKDELIHAGDDIAWNY